MSLSRFRFAMLALCSGLAACAAPPTPPAALDDGAPTHQLLVMLHLPAPHFRPDVSYGGSYDVRLGGDARRRTAEAIASKFGLKLVDDWPMPALGVDCFVMEAPDDAPVARLQEAIAQDSRVESVQPVQLFHVLAHNDPLYPLQPTATAWHLADLHRLTTGRHVRVAEVDTGVELDHPDLVGRIAEERNFVDARRDVAEAHGTAVAGIIAARADDAIGIAGVAPDAELYALRACWERSAREPAVCSSFTLAKAMQYAIERKAQVINLSLGGPRDRLLERLIDVAIGRGTAVVGAVDPEARDGGFPAAHLGVLAVAGDDVQDAPAGALRAPGRDIPTTTTPHKWGFVTGSSFAAAQVSGLVALLDELDPRLQPTELLRQGLLARTAGGEAQPVVDACAAVAKAAGTCACQCALAHDSIPSTSR